MGKVARFACILTPMLCTIASIICLIIIMVGGTNKNIGWVGDLYFLKIDTRFATSPNSLNLLPGTKIDDALLQTGIGKTSTQLGLHDFYTAHLWNYCSGTITNDTGSLVYKVDQCTKPTGSFYFNIVEIFKVDAAANGKSGVPDGTIPTAIHKINNTIRVVSNIMVAMYCCGLAASVATFVLGWFGLLSRWGSCVTTIFADVAFLFLLTAAAITSALYASLTKGFTSTFSQFGVYAYANPSMLILLWLTVGFSFAAALFWMLSTCCCSGRSNRIMGRGNNGKSRGEKAPYGYEKVATPYMPTQTIQTPAPQHTAPGYEPYRHAGGH